MGFTAAELAEMARADAEIEATFRLTNEDIALGRQIDRDAVLEGMDARARRRPSTSGSTVRPTGRR